MLKEIGRQFDIVASGVSQTSRRTAMQLSQDNKLSKKIRKVENKLNLSRMKTWPPVIFDEFTPWLIKCQLTGVVVLKFIH